MKPVLILQHVDNDGPAYLGTWLSRQAVGLELRNTGAGQDFPASLEGYSALAVLGGPMSANDPLPSLVRAQQLIREAVSSGIPVLGHCLGGQLMAKALGASVGPSEAPEIGWQRLQPRDDPHARLWLGEHSEHTVMHWHYESFGLPEGASWIAHSPACAHQAFALGPHLAMQFHIEIDAPKLERWMQESDPKWDLALGRHPSVQDRQSILDQAPGRLAAHHALADRIYARWLSAAR